MDVFKFVIIIVLIGTVGGIVKEVLRNKRKSELKSNQWKDERIEALEERVATLERILTDDKERLKREIDSLHREEA
ncbi:hypothetical protein [Saccharospirillum salsuginis]|uniref:Phage shock protein B n=1 Tax=Saccharospirillum salsuginis TaxID=418750 RepID=A0A918K4T6_9GAMM|nr:hypothetical protein [Saccharospirillum salsuginis]GGX49967.1 hypothetical protein GCM10007392_16730 [Saccharospirillum salsuginis]